MCTIYVLLAADSGLKGCQRPCLLNRQKYVVHMRIYVKAYVVVTYASCVNGHGSPIGAGSKQVESTGHQQSKKFSKMTKISPFLTALHIFYIP